MPLKVVATTAAGLRPRPGGDMVLHATNGHTHPRPRVIALEHDVAELDVVLARLVTTTAPTLLAVHGVGVDTAAEILIAAGDNSERIRTEAAFAHLCGAAPIPAGSGKTDGRRRLNRGGNRHANHALWRIAITDIGTASVHRSESSDTAASALPLPNAATYASTACRSCVSPS